MHYKLSHYRSFLSCSSRHVKLAKNVESSNTKTKKWASTFQSLNTCTVSIGVGTGEGEVQLILSPCSAARNFAHFFLLYKSKTEVGKQFPKTRIFWQEIWRQEILHVIGNAVFCSMYLFFTEALKSHYISLRWYKCIELKWRKKPR